MALPAGMRNLYRLRTSADKEGYCFVCNKPSLCVLTCDDIDWFFVCQSHTTDPSFCKPAEQAAPAPAAKAAPPQPAKAAPAPPKKTPADDNRIPDTAAKASPPKAATGASSAPSASAARTASPSPKLFVLHPDIYFLREKAQRDKAAKKSAQELMQRMPAIPK